MQLICSRYVILSFISFHVYMWMSLLNIAANQKANYWQLHPKDIQKSSCLTNFPVPHLHMIHFTECFRKAEIILWKYHLPCLKHSKYHFKLCPCQVLTRLLPPQTERWPSQCPDWPTWKEKSLSGTCRKRGTADEDCTTNMQCAKLRPKGLDFCLFAFFGW